jgi:hypothetical protein
MKISPDLVEKRRRVLEQEHGKPFLTVAEAARRLGIHANAIYNNPARYSPIRYESSVFVAAEVVESIRSAPKPTRECIEVRGVEYEGGVGRMDVVRHLCLPCRRYYRSRDLFDSHACGGA